MRGTKGVVALLAGGLVHAAVVALTVSAAHAHTPSSVTSPLNTAFSSALGSGPFGTVTIGLLQAGTSLIGTVTFMADPGYEFEGGTNDLELNLLNTNFTCTYLSSPCTTPNTPLSITQGPNAAILPGFGPFNVAISFESQFFQTMTIQFDISGGASFCPQPGCDASSLLVANSLGFDAAALIVQSSNPTGPSEFVGECVTTCKVPEPTSLALFGTALAGLYLFCGGYIAGPRLRARV